jgi:glycosyltransferase involved in cell wall biosynthesis
MPLDTSLARSYGVAPVSIPHNRLKKYAEANSISIVLHHRTSSSRSYREFLPENVAYIVVNHSVANPISLKRFVDCDFYISVCDFLDSFVTWPSGIHPSRKAVILNGVEDSYLAEIPSANLSGTFKSGRCHRLVPTKFKSDSLTWFQEKVASAIPGSVHYVIGNNQQLKQEFGDCYRVKLLGTIYDRFQKMSIIKSFDVYFYETFYVEGASIAILESLACGVPVLCKSLGGCPELIRDGVNGFIFKDRKDALRRLKDLARNRSKLRELVESTQADFLDRLHIRHTACRYVQVFEAVLRNRGVSK